MRKRFLPLLALVALASCTQNEMDLKESNDQVPIMLGANALSVDASTRAPFEGTIGAGNELTAYVAASVTEDDYTTRYAVGTMVFANETDPVGYIIDNTTNPAVAFNGKSYYPADGTKLYLAALYPATGWANPTQTTTFTFTGKEDVMAAAQVSADKTAHAAITGSSPIASTIPAFNFKHLLTKLNLKFKAEDQAAIDAWGTVSKIELIAAQGSGSNIWNKIEVTLKTGGASTGSGFTGHTAGNPFKCYVYEENASNVLEYTDTEYVSQAYSLTTTDIYQAYTLVAPVTATGTGDFTFRVYATGAKETAGQKYVDVPVDLKKGGTAFTGDTQGKAFDITLLFKAKIITATASVTGWNVDDLDNDDTVIE